MFGSKLASKMWVTIAEKGIGGLLKPWAIRRESIAMLQAERNKLLVLAQTKIDIEDVKKGKSKISLDDLSNPKIIKSEGSLCIDDSNRHEPTIDIESLTKSLTTNFVANELQKEINLSKSLFIAENILEKDKSDPIDEAIDDDWIYRWREAASATTSDIFQSLWGRILAGEIKTPGTYSLRTLDFIKNLSQKEAIDIEKFYTFTLNGCVIKRNIYENFKEDIEEFDDNLIKKGLTFNFLRKMQALGLTSGVESGGALSTLKSSSNQIFRQNFLYEDKALVITHKDSNKNLELHCYLLTELGLELYLLSKPTIDIDYLNFVISLLKKSEFELHIGDVHTDENGVKKLINIISV